METKTDIKLIPELTLKYKKGYIPVKQIKNSIDAVDVVKTFYDKDTISLYESVVVLFLDCQNYTLGYLRVSNGGITESIVDLRIILSTALKCCATRILMSHNHPSGNIYPSNSDDKITQKLKKSCELMDINLMDHLIVTENDDVFYSFANEGKI